MKKTKKQKIISDLRKKMAQIESPIHETYSLNSFQTTESPKTLQNHFPSNNSSKIDALQISKDLKKTISLSILIFVSLIFLKYFLKA